MTEAFMHDILIFGAGPAGLMAACTAKAGRVAILEKNEKPGRKLKIAGSGRCNITHAGKIADFYSHYAGAARFVKPCLMAFTNQDLIRFFAARGLRMTEVNDGKIFPATQRAEDVLRVLTEACRTCLAEIFYSQTVTRVAFQEEDACFHVETQNTAGGGGAQTWRAKKIIIATGGKSYPVTGSTGDGYELAKMLGHTIIPPRPALTPVHVDAYPFTPCAGISLENRPVSVWRDGKKIAAHTGDILFTHRGFSGPGILDFSRYVQSGDTLKIAFTGDADTAVLGKILVEAFTQNSKKTVKNILVQRFTLPERLGECLLELAEIATGMLAWEMDRGARARLAETLAGHPFHVRRLGDFREAMCTAGGVWLEEVNRQSMESRIRPGLFFCGEVLDVDGDTGGYNLQFAFSSGAAAGAAASATSGGKQA